MWGNNHACGDAEKGWWGYLVPDSCVVGPCRCFSAGVADEERHGCLGEYVPAMFGYHADASVGLMWTRSGMST